MGERGAEFWRYDDAELRGWRHGLRNSLYSWAVDHVTIAAALVVLLPLLLFAWLDGWVLGWCVIAFFGLGIPVFFGRSVDQRIGQKFGPPLRWKGWFQTTSGAKNLGLVNRQREAGRLTFQTADEFGRTYLYRVPAGFSPADVEAKADALAAYFGAHRLVVKRMTPTTVQIWAADRDAITESHSAEWITHAG